MRKNLVKDGRNARSVRAACPRRGKFGPTARTHILKSEQRNFVRNDEYSVVAIIRTRWSLGRTGEFDGAS